MIYLPEHHGNRFMSVDNGTERALALQWLFYLMSTFQPEVLIQFNAERYFPEDKSMQQALKSASLRDTTRHRQTPNRKSDRILEFRSSQFART